MTSNLCTSATARYKKILFSYEWIIENFDNPDDEQDQNWVSYSFPVSMVPHSHEVTWYLEACRIGFNREDQVHLIIHLYQDSGKFNIDNAILKISVLDERREEIESKTTELTLSRSPFIFRDYGQADYYNNSRSGEIIIFCEIYTLEDNVQCKSDDFTIPECTLPNDFGHLFENGKYYDFTLSVGNYEFRVHKIVLGTRSSVFEQMFKNAMETNKVVICDVDQAVMKEMLRYIYTGRANISNDIAIGLLDAAKKYALERLKLLCAQVLYINLTVENAAQIFTVADQYDIVQLKNGAKRFITLNAKKVINTSGWDLISRTHPHLLKEAYAALTTYYV